MYYLSQWFYNINFIDYVFKFIDNITVIYYC